ncbi:MAG: hypothetical protein JJ895_01115 [Balneolaceae bacterium]|nr:hypothetical protein [Balneolaceae bacterium]
MSDKLTLRIEKKLIERAKKYATKNGTSVSKLVADYFKAIDSEIDPLIENLPPVTQSLSGVVKGSKLDEKDYRSHLHDKYLK